MFVFGGKRYMFGQLELFEKPADYSSFEKILAEAHKSFGVRVAAYCLMPNHWHLLLWPRAELSEVMRWISVTIASAGMLTAIHLELVRSIRDASNRFRFSPINIF